MPAGQRSARRAAAAAPAVVAVVVVVVAVRVVVAVVVVVVVRLLAVRVDLNNQKRSSVNSGNCQSIVCVFFRQTSKSARWWTGRAAM
jgi:hypothetical protein